MEVSTFSQLQKAMVRLVEEGSQSAVIYVTDMEQEKLEGYMPLVLEEITANSAIGAYAVDSISYEVGKNGRKLAVAVEVTYVHNRSEILRIKKTHNMEEAARVVTSAIENCSPSVVILVESYTTTDFTQLIQDYVDRNPHSCMEMPQVTANLYPEQGTERVVELSFAYQTSRDTLRSMQQTVKPVFDSARLYLNQDAMEWVKYEQLYSFLMERHDYTVETSITPAYSLLRHGVGDSKAFAVVYAAMCRQAELPCEVVSGTKEGSPWFWNVIRFEGNYYYLDLLRCSENSQFETFTQEQMQGYVWDYSAYPQQENRQG